MVGIERTDLQGFAQMPAADMAARKLEKDEVRLH